MGQNKVPNLSCFFPNTGPQILMQQLLTKLRDRNIRRIISNVTIKDQPARRRIALGSHIHSETIGEPICRPLQAV
jgi:hypothetical protein